MVFLLLFMEDVVDVCFFPFCFFVFCVVIEGEPVPITVQNIFEKKPWVAFECSGVASVVLFAVFPGISFVVISRLSSWITDVLSLVLDTMSTSRTGASVIRFSMFDNVLLLPDSMPIGM